MNKKRVLITGASGFIGQFVLKEMLKNEDIDFFAIDTRKIPNISIEKLELVSLLDKEKLMEIIKRYKPNIIIHLAAIALVTHDNVGEIYNVNVQGTENLLEVSKGIESIKEIFANSDLSGYYLSLENAEEDIEELDILGEYQSQIDEFEDTKKILLSSLKQLEEELMNAVRPNLEEEHKKLQNIEDEVSNFIEKIAILTTRLSNNKKLYEKIHSEYLKLLETSKDTREIIALSDVVSGKTENRKSLETYVQGYYLDLILVAGTKRLLQMTNDRYRFIRREEKSKGGGLQGLEIEIHDIYLNSTRIISSLSGGELFLASLALALGLAEVIQNESGGISLETIFIDEGFGSLDAETLDIALTTLIDLQSYGRNIGIISHVSELKERIRPKIEVYTKDNYAKVKMTGI